MWYCSNYFPQSFELQKNAYDNQSQSGRILMTHA